MSVRSTIAVLLLVLLSWGVLEAGNAAHMMLGIGSTLALILKCGAIALIGAGAGLGLGTWADAASEQPALASYLAVGPWVALVHFANYITAAALVSFRVEVALMIVGAFVVQAGLRQLVKGEGE
jgi:hypothetical protein